MNTEMVPRHYKVSDEQIDDGDIQSVITPLWWAVSIYDGETEMYDALDNFTDPQKYVWAVQWYYAEVENGGHDQFFYNDTGIVWSLALEGLREMGCDTVAEILEQAAHRLGGTPSFDRATRWQEMERHNAEFDDLDQEFYECDSLLDKAIREYVRSNREDFYFDGTVYFPESMAPDEYGEEEY